VLLQDGDDLLLAEPALTHDVRLLIVGRTLHQNGYPFGVRVTLHQSCLDSPDHGRPSGGRRPRPGDRRRQHAIFGVTLHYESFCKPQRNQDEITAMMEPEQHCHGPMMPRAVAAPALTDFPVRTVEKLRFADTDRHGHITNTVFAACCQNARMELLYSSKRVPTPPNTQFVIARLVLDFRAEMHWPGTVEIGTRVDRIGRSSITLAQALFMAGQCVATAESIVALVNTTTRRPIPLTREVAQALLQIARLECKPMCWRPGDARCSDSEI
jgi:acyl-CoA thioester hydrolase